MFAQPEAVTTPDDAAASRSLQCVRSVASDEVGARVHLPEDLTALPRVFLSVGPCRSGTTVFLRVFAASGVRASGKPLKVILRWLLQGPDVGHARGWAFPAVPAIYLKESIGPYSPQECAFNPLRALYGALARIAGESGAADHLRGKVHLVVTGRVPEHSWLSWLAKYGAFVPRDALFRNYLAAHETVAAVRRDALAWGVPVTHYVLEAHTRAGAAVAGLFGRLGLANEPVITGWKKLPAFPSEESGIEIPEQPVVYDRTGRFDKILNSDGLTYFARSREELASIPDAERRAMQDAVLPLYTEWKRCTERDLGVALPDE